MVMILYRWSLLRVVRVSSLTRNPQGRLRGEQGKPLRYTCLGAAGCGLSQVREDTNLGDSLINLK